MTSGSLLACRAVKRTALTALAAAAAIAALVMPGAAGADPKAQASAETLVNFVGPKKLKVGKKFTYRFVCVVNCNISVSDVLKGPGGKLTGSISGSLAAGAPGGVRIKPNGPLLKAMKAETGKFKLAVTIRASDPTTGETDIDKRTYKFK
jgi:hypothetical protein